MASESFVKIHLRSAKVAVNLALNEAVKERQRNGETIYHLAFGQSPFPIPECFTSALKENAGAHDYLPVTGTAELRREICSFHKEFNGVEYSPDNLVVSCGSKELIYLTMQVFDGDVILISPGWTTYAPQVNLTGRTPHIIQTTLESQWKVTPTMLENALSKKNLSKNKLMILNNPGNPTGASYTKEEYNALVPILRKHNVVVLSDEIYGFLNFTDNHVSLCELYPERTLTTSGFSKWSSAGGWRVGYVHVPKEMSDILHALKAAGTQTYSCAPAPMQHALATGLKNREELSRYMHLEKRILKAAADYTCKHLQTSGVKCLPSHSGYYLFPDFEICRTGFANRGILTGQQMCETMLKEIQVALLPGSAFLTGPSDFTVRLCYINFDGAAAMKHVESGASEILDDPFVEKFMPELAEAVRRLKVFTENHTR